MGASPDEILSMVFFARVVEAKSFTGAAVKLGVSKSVVSARVAALEEQLKVRLLHRTTRKLSLTPEGLALFERCARVVAAADEASVAAAGAGDTPRGVLRVNAPIVFAEEYLAPPIAAYLARYPDTRVQMSVNDRAIDLVEEGVDVAVRISARPHGGGLTARKLAVDHTVLCASPAYLARRGVPAAPGELLAHDCLVYALLKVEQEWRFRVAHGRGRGRARGKDAASVATAAPVAIPVPIRGRFSAESGALLRRAALAGMGLAVLPTFMIADDLVAGRLQRVLVDSFVGAALGIYVVFPEGKRVPSKVRAFVDLLVAHFRSPPWAR